MTDQEQQQHANAGDGYEKKDASVAWIATMALLIVAVIAAFAIGLNEFFLISKENLIYEKQLSTRNKVLRDLRAREQEGLYSYKVLHADSGRYQIPIERAMKLLADEAYQAQRTKTKK